MTKKEERAFVKQARKMKREMTAASARRLLVKTGMYEKNGTLKKEFRLNNG